MLKDISDKNLNGDNKKNSFSNISQKYQIFFVIINKFKYSRNTDVQYR